MSAEARPMAAPALREGGRLACALAVVILSTVVAQIVQDGALGPLTATALTARAVPVAMAGMVVAAPYLGNGLFSLPAGRLHVALGPARCMVLGAGLTVAGLLLYPLWIDPWAWTGIGLVIGVGMALRWVSGESWLIGITPPRLQGRVIGFQETLIGLASVLGPVLLAVSGTRGATPFLACVGVMLVGLALPVVGAMLGADHRPDPTLEGRLHERSPAIGAAVLMSGFVGGAIESGAHSFLPVIVLPAELFQLPSVLAASVFSLGGSVFQLPFGALVDRFGARAFVVPVAASTVVVGGIFAVAPNGDQSVWLLFLLGAAAGCYYTLALLRVAELPTPGSVARGVSRLALANTCGSVAGPVMMGAAIDLVGPAGLGATVAALGAVQWLVSGDWTATVRGSYDGAAPEAGGTCRRSSSSR